MVVSPNSIANNKANCGLINAKLGGNVALINATFRQFSDSAHGVFGQLHAFSVSVLSGHIGPSAIAWLIPFAAINPVNALAF